MREDNLDLETTATLGLNSTPIVEVDSSSTSKDACEVAKSASAIKEAAQENLTPHIYGGKNLVLVKGEDDNGAASSFTRLDEEIA